jgi:hypothetical protein
MLGEQVGQGAKGFLLVRLARTMAPPRTIDGKVAEQGLQIHRVASFPGAGVTAVRALASVFQVFRGLVLHNDLLHRRQQALTLCQAETDIRQAMPVALHAGDLLDVRATFGFNADLDDGFHAPMMSQNNSLPLAESILPESLIYLAPVNALRARVPMRFHPLQRRPQAFTICHQRRDVPIGVEYTLYASRSSL